MRILKSIDFTGKFQKPEFKPLIKNLHKELHQGSINNLKVQKFVPVSDLCQFYLRVKNAPKLSVKYLKDKICKTKHMQTIPGTLRTFLNQLKNF